MNNHATAILRYELRELGFKRVGHVLTRKTVGILTDYFTKNITDIVNAINLLEGSNLAIKVYPTHVDIII